MQKVTDHGGGAKLVLIARLKLAQPLRFGTQAGQHMHTLQYIGRGMHSLSHRRLQTPLDEVQKAKNYAPMIS